MAPILLKWESLFTISNFLHSTLNILGEIVGFSEKFQGVISNYCWFPLTALEKENPRPK